MINLSCSNNESVAGRGRARRIQNATNAATATNKSQPFAGSVTKAAARAAGCVCVCACVRVCVNVCVRVCPFMFV